jgi:hypothetical protein
MHGLSTIIAMNRPKPTAAERDAALEKAAAAWANMEYRKGLSRGARQAIATTRSLNAKLSRHANRR